MDTLTKAIESARAAAVEVKDGTLFVTLTDGRTITAPLEWYPRLAHSTPAQLQNWRLIGRGVGINWPDIDEDLSVAGLLAGYRSMESPSSFARWLEARKQRLA